MTREEFDSLKIDYLYELKTPTDKGINLVTGFHQDGLVDDYLCCALTSIDCTDLDGYAGPFDVDPNWIDWEIWDHNIKDIILVRELGHKDNFPEYFL